MHLRPTHDPLVSLVHYLTPSDIAHVFVDGNHLVRDGAISGLDDEAVVADAQRVQDKMRDTFAEWVGLEERDELFESSYPVDPSFDRSR